jgi:hypothetical protein
MPILVISQTEKLTAVEYFNIKTKALAEITAQIITNVR